MSVPAPSGKRWGKMVEVWQQIFTGACVEKKNVSRVEGIAFGESRLKDCDYRRGRKAGYRRNIRKYSECGGCSSLSSNPAQSRRHTPLLSGSHRKPRNKLGKL